jgi:hypothetical protein
MQTLATPKVQTTTKTITGFTVGIRNVVLNQSADLEISLFGEGETLLDMKFIKLEGTAYDAWGASDNYILEFVATWIQDNL